VTERRTTGAPISREFYAGIGIGSSGDVTVAWAFRARSAQGTTSESVLAKRVFESSEVANALPRHLAERAPRAVYIDDGDGALTSPVASIARSVGKLVAVPSRSVTRLELKIGCEEILARTTEHPLRGDLLRVAHQMLSRNLDMPTLSGQFAVGMLLAIYALRVYRKSDYSMIIC
jgi:hypothetical protein